MLPNWTASSPASSVVGRADNWAELRPLICAVSSDTILVVDNAFS